MSKKYVLFSPIGDHDPINIKDYSEGSMLHIIRHYKPEVVYLFLTKEMQEKDKKDNRYEIAIRQMNFDCEIKKISADIEKAHDFDEFIEYFSEIIEKIRNDYPDYEILLNISSGTPQIKSNLILEVISNRNKLIPVQVESPANGSNTREDKFELEMLQKIDIKKEAENKRCFEPKIVSFKKAQLITQIKSLINNYEYESAKELFEKSNINNLFNERVLKILNHCYYRKNLNIKKAMEYYDYFYENEIFEYFYTIKIKQKKGELADFALRIPPILTELLKDFVNEEIVLKDVIEEREENGKTVSYITRKKLEEYDKRNKTKILQYIDKRIKGNEYHDQFVNITTLKMIANYYAEEVYKNDTSSVACKYNEKNNLFGSFLTFEQIIRNTLAHEMTNIDEKTIIEKCGLSSSKLLLNLEKLLTRIKDFPKGKFIYDELNEELIKLL